MPFTKEIAVERRLRMDHIEEQVTALKKTVEARKSAALIAPAGGGKSVVLRALKDSLPPARYTCHYIKVTDISVRDMCRQLASGVGAESAGTYPALVRSLQERFEQYFDTDGLRPVVMIDEAHDLRPKTAALLKILTNFDMDSRLVVSIILAGQPALKKLLEKQGYEEIRRRLDHCGELRLLSREETKSYIEHRVAVAGATVCPFDKQAIEAVFEISRGNMGGIDLLASKALEQADKAGHKTVGSDDVVAGRKNIWWT